MLVISSQSRLLGSNPIVWLRDEEPVKFFQKGPPPEKAKLKRWLTYLSQFRLTVHHIPGIKNELCDYISHNNFDAVIGESSEALAKEALQCMDVQLDLSMQTAGILEGWSLTDYQSEYKVILETLSTGLEPRVIDGHQWYKNNQYLSSSPNQQASLTTKRRSANHPASAALQPSGADVFQCVKSNSLFGVFTQPATATVAVQLTCIRITIIARDAKACSLSYMAC